VQLIADRQQQPQHSEHAVATLDSMPSTKSSKDMAVLVVAAVDRRHVPVVEQVAAVDDEGAGGRGDGAAPTPFIAPWQPLTAAATPLPLPLPGLHVPFCRCSATTLYTVNTPTPHWHALASTALTQHGQTCRQLPTYS